MRLRALTLTATLLPLTAPILSQNLPQPKPFTLQQVLSAPYATELTAAPVGDLFAWVEDSEGRHNLWVGAPGKPARQLTHNTADDGLDLTELAWSPDGSAIAYTYSTETGADGKPSNPAHLQRSVEAQVIVQPIEPDARPVHLGAGHGPLFDPLNHQVFFTRAGQIWTAPLGIACVSEGGGCHIEVSPSDTHQLVVDRGVPSSLTLSPDGKTLAFISTRRETNQPAHRFLALFDLATKTESFAAPSTGNDSAPAWSPDGKQLAWLRSPFTRAPQFSPNRVSANPWSIQLFDMATHTTRTVFTPEANKPGSVLPHMATGEPRLFWTADGRLVFPSEADRFVHLYALDTTAAKPPVLLTPGTFEVEDPTLSADGWKLAFAANNPVSISENACAKPPCMIARTSEDLLDIDRRHIWTISFHMAEPHPFALTYGDGIETRPVFSQGIVAALISDVREPMLPAVILPSGLKQPLRPEAPPADYPADRLITPQQILFTATDGIPLHAQLFLPKNLDPTKKHPALLFFHGGPRRQMLLGYPAMGYYSNAYAMNQYLASQGFIVLSTNYRCGVGYGMDFRQCLHGGGDGSAEFADLLAAAKYIRSRADVDPKHIGVWGGSYGGLFTALALARNSDLFAAGVDFHGVHDWNLEDNSGGWLIGSYADKDATAAKAFTSSAMSSVAKWTSPVLLIHGDNDANVAYAQTPILADKLRAQGTHVEELIFPDEIHEFELHGDWLKAYQAEAAFFEKLLKP